MTVFSPRISVILACRINGNRNSKLLHCVRMLIANAADIGAFELLIKFDDDDPDAPAAIASLQQEKAHITCMVTPRGAGYTDLHKAYMDMVIRAAGSVELFWCITDDLEVLTPHWDNVILSVWEKHRTRTCVLHARKTRDLRPMDWLQAVEADAYPIWSRKWMSSVGLGYTFSVDGWTAYIEYILFKKYGIDNRVAVADLRIKRSKDPETDIAGTNRWNSERKQMFAVMETTNFLQFAEQAAEGAAIRIRAEGGIVVPFSTRRRWWLTAFLRRFRSKKP